MSRARNGSSMPFIRSLPRDEPNCIEWPFARNEHGYGITTLNGKTAKAHRVAFSIHHGVFPAELKVMHKCDNPACVNPDHLCVGTQSENLADMRSKGRTPTGENHKNSKLTACLVIDARAKYRAGMSVSSLAKECRVDWGTMRKAIRGETWGHVN